MIKRRRRSSWSKFKLHGWQIHVLFSQLIILAWFMGVSYANRDQVIAFANETPVVVTVHASESLEPEMIARNLIPRERTDLEVWSDAIAKVLYGMRHNSEEDLRCVVWVIINRHLSGQYPADIVEVCEQPNQWFGYTQNNPIVRNLYDLAYEELSNWQNDDARWLSADYLYFTWSEKQIVFRTCFNETSNCHYWRNP